MKWIPVLLLLLMACGDAPVHERITDRNGHMTVELDRCNGLKQGEARFLWPDGTLRMAGCYATDLRVGWWRELDEHGRLRAVSHFRKGRKEGLEAYWNEDHGLVRVEHFTRGVPNGELIKFYDDGMPEQWSHFKNGEMDGPHYHWWRQGNKPASALIGSFADGLTSGEWIEMTPDRRIIWRAIFRNGREVRTIVERAKP